MGYSIKEEAAPKLGGRGGTIGGTSWGALLGMGKYRTPHDIWMRIKGIDDPTPQNDAMRRGIRLEPIVADIAAKKLDLALRVPSRESVYWPKPYRRFSASVDRDGYDGETYVGPIELKTMSDRADWGACGPAEYRLQLQSYIWQRHLAAMARGRAPVDWGYLACVQTSSDVFGMTRNHLDVEHALSAGLATLHCHRFRREDIFFEEVVPYAEWWWKTYIDGDKPPPADAHSSSALQALHKHYDFEPETECEITPEMAVLVDAFQRAEAELSRINKDQRSAKAERDGAKTALLESMNGHGRATDGALVVEASISRRADLDKTALKAARPELWEEYSKLGNPSAKLKIYSTGG